MNLDQTLYPRDQDYITYHQQSAVGRSENPKGACIYSPGSFEEGFAPICFKI